ncbi:MAG: glycosyltransferase N-terminal domain-containing protein [Thermodesulfobacteriota bacterium]
MKSGTLNIAFRLYEAGWRLAMPLLKIEPRLKDGYPARAFVQRPPGPADIWIQAASAGEAYLAVSLIKGLPPDRDLRVLVSTNTRQGLEILAKAAADQSAQASRLSIALMFCPFDRPSVMDAAVRHIQPRVMVLLESELWPGLLYALKRYNRKTMIVNGRMTDRSLKRYRLLPGFCKALAPDKVLAMSPDDAGRFAALFGPDRVETMPSMKFDGVRVEGPESQSALAIRNLLPKDSRFLVFGSIRQEEEPLVLDMIRLITGLLPGLVVGLFPRHMHRLDAWRQLLAKAGIKWVLRSALSAGPAGPDTVVLWDTFGELNAAYAEAAAVFVGGSLAPLGGQNFLEPLVHGVVPVIGPYWDNFTWVGEELFSAGLVRKTPDWQAAAAELVVLLEAPPSRQTIRDQAAAFISQRQGGTAQACRRILEALD